MLKSKPIKQKLSAQLFRKIFSYVSEGLILCNDETKIVKVNPVAADILNSTPKKLIDRKLDQVIITIDTKKLQKFTHTFLSPKSPTTLLLGIFVPPDDLLHLEISKHLNLTPGIHLLRVRDITQTHAHHVRQNKFVAIAGHELKNPVAIIKAYSQFLQKRLEGGITKPNLKYLKKIEQNANTLNKLISDIIDEIKAGSNELSYNDKKINLDHLIRSIIADNQKVHPKRHFIIKGEIKDNLKLDKTRIIQVFTNILSNAIKYSASDKKIIVSLKNNKDSIVISVQDFGKGIAKNEEKMIFNPFFRSQSKNKTKTSGLGLGLYLTKRIIHHYRGKIWFESKYNQGTTFFVQLPKR